MRGSSFVGQFHDDASSIGRVRRPVDLAAQSGDACFELLEITVEIGEGVLFDAFGVIAQGTAVVERRVAPSITGHQGVGESAQRHLERRIGERDAGGVQKIVVFVAGIVVHGEIITTWRTRDD